METEIERATGQRLVEVLMENHRYREALQAIAGMTYSPTTADKLLVTARSLAREALAPRP